ncbi:MAG: hypothetical protein ACO1SX_06655 [Actinomycetota bacterium]
MTREQLLLICFPAAGFVGALIGSAVRNGRLELPRLVMQRESDGQVRKWIDPGFLLSTVVGALLAAWIDGRPWTAVFVGVTVGYVGPSILVTLVIEPLAKKLGHTLSLVPVPSHSPENRGTP